MNSEKVMKAENPQAVDRALQVLMAGGVLVYPTETLYGLGALVSSTEAVERIFHIKGRDSNMSLPILVRDFKMLEEYASMPAKYKEILQKLMPGPFMAILKLNSDLNPLITGGKDTIGIRISSNNFVTLLMEELNVPLISTSANLSGTANIYDIDSLISVFGDKVDLVVDSGSISPSKGSTIVDFTIDPPRILREGDLSKAEIEQYF